MARHSTGARNNRVAGSFIVMVLAIVVVAALFAWWLMSRHAASTNNAQDTSCTAGELTLPVAGDTPQLIQQLVDKYNESKSVLGGKCVTATASDSLDSAGVYLSGSSDKETVDTLQVANRTPSTADWPVVGSEAVGVATKSGYTWDSDAAITYASKGNAMVSAFVATAKGADATSVATTVTASAYAKVSDVVAEGKDNIAVAENQLPEGYTFVKAQKDGSDVLIPLRAVALSGNDQVSEEVADAASDFAAKSASSNSNALTSSVSVAAFEALAQVTANTSASSTETAAPKANVEDTLFLLDTSNGMGAELDDHSWYAAAASDIHDAALKIGDAGKQVYLWNYSSPISERVNQGWRTNVGFNDTSNGRNAAEDVLHFGTGGVPQSRSAVSAALKAAANNGEPLRVVLIVSGTEDSYDLQAAIDAARSAGNITLDVIAVGQNDLDESLSIAATELGGTVTHATDSTQLTTAIANASGV